MSSNEKPVVILIDENEGVGGMLLTQLVEAFGFDFTSGGNRLSKDSIEATLRDADAEKMRRIRGIVVCVEQTVQKSDVQAALEFLRAGFPSAYRCILIDDDAGWETLTLSGPETCINVPDFEDNAYTRLATWLRAVNGTVA